MQTLSTFRRSALLALALGTASATTAFAQDTTIPATVATEPPTPATSPSEATTEPHQHTSVLDSAERAELRNARNAAFAASPALKTEHDTLTARFQALKAQGSSASRDDWASLHSDRESFETKLHTAELQADPGLGPVLGKLAYAHKHRHQSTT